MVTVTTEIDLADIDVEDIVEYLEDLGYYVSPEKTDTNALYNIYKDFIEWDENRMNDSTFATNLGKFFRNAI